MPSPSSRSGKDDAAMLRLVVEGTVSETGSAFFRALTRNLAEALGTLGAWVTELDPERKRLHALAMWLDGDFVDHYEYAIEGTACASVLESRQLVHIPERLIELYPEDLDLVPLDAVSYLGMPLLDVGGGVMGHLAVLDDRPMPPSPRSTSLFEIFGARAAAEMRRLRAEGELRDREEQLALLLGSALDAIVVADAEWRVVRANPAAARLFSGETPESLAGRRMEDLLAPESAARLRAFAREIEARPEGEQQLWVPEDIVARRLDGSVFPAEATLSRFVSRQGPCFTLILRNANERLEAERQIRLLTQETEFLREAVRDLPGPGELVGRSAGMRALLESVERVAGTDSTVLVTGETGTGKELVARLLHRSSARAEKPLVLVNCAAIPANLIESEFFGHERGAFTGAVARREGRFAQADGGTIFLDEIGELPLELQAKLLRVLQEGEFEPLGSGRTRRVDVRVVAATNRDLRRMCEEGEFREDLYFRLNVFPVLIPPLRERGRDVELLADCFVQRLSARMGRRCGPLDEGQRQLLRSYDWPGNVRELQNVVERAIILSRGGHLALERAMAGIAPAGNGGAAVAGPGGERIFTAREMQDLEKANLRRALELCGGRISGEQGAARLLGLPPTTLSSRLKALGLERPRR